MSHAPPLPATSQKRTDFWPPLVLTRHARRQPATPALSLLQPDAPAVAFTYRQLQEAVTAYAHFLRGEGVSPGALLILAFDHSPALIIAFLGALSVGAVPTIFPYYSRGRITDGYRRRLQALVRAVRPDAILTRPAQQGALRAIVADHCPVLAHDAARPPTPPPDFTPVPPTAAPAYIQFSSGTTGQPKGIVLSRAAVAAHLAAAAAAGPVTDADVVVGWAPLFHDMGLVNHLLLPLAVGAHAVLMAPEHWVRRPHDLLWAIHEHQGTMTCMPNFGLTHTLQHVRPRQLEGLDLSSWRLLGLGGAEPIVAADLHAFSERFTPYGLQATTPRVGYGLAENVLTATQTPPGQPVNVDYVNSNRLIEAGRAIPAAANDPNRRAVVSCGVPFPETTVAIVDAAGTLLPERQVGRVLVKSPWLFDEYFQQPVLTARRRRDGYLHTGDLGYMADGQLYICQRREDVIIVGGQNVYPDMLEEVARTVLGPPAGHIVAFGVSDPALGTEAPVVVAEYMRYIESTAEKEQLTTAVRQRIQADLNVSLWDVRLVRRGWVPITTSGKVARTVTRDKYLADSDGARLPAGLAATLAVWQRNGLPAREELTDVIRGWFGQLLGQAAVPPEGNFFNLGGDSLGLLRLLGQIEDRLGRDLPISQLLAQPTPAHIAAILTGAETPVPADDAAPGRLDTIPYLWQVATTARVSRWHRRQHIQKVARYELLSGGPQGRLTLPYGSGHRLLTWLGRSHWLPRLLAPEANAARQAAALLPGIVDADIFVQQHLTFNVWRKWRLAALTRPAARQKWLRWDGLDRLAAAQATGRGIILLHTHFVLIGLLRHVTPPLPAPLDPTITLGLAKAESRYLQLQRWQAGETANIKNIRRRLVTGQLYAAAACLRQGGLVNIAGDGFLGRGTTIPFFGRRRRLGHGFAQLALQTDAVVLTTRTVLMPSGHVTVHFDPPLTPASDGPISARRDALTLQYAARLRANWAAQPANITWRHLQAFLNFPELDT